MKVTYNSNVYKLTDVKWQKDWEKVVGAMNAAAGKKIVLRARQAPNDKVEVDITELDLDEGLKKVGVDIAKSFDLELVIRTPHSAHGIDEALRGNRGYLDRRDYNQLQWSGERGTGTIPSHPIRNSPMFFRDNGMNVDLVDLYAGESVFLILNGPSFADVDKSLLQRPGIVTFGINNGAHGFRPDLWTCVDDPTRFLSSIWSDPKIMKFIPLAHFEKPLWDRANNRVTEARVKEYPNVIGFRRNEQFEADQWLYEDTINWGNHGDRGGGRSVMLSALKICYLLGFRNVYLVGCDFKMTEQKGYWFEEERSKQAVKNNTKSYEIMRGYFRELLPHFESVGFSVHNCTEGSDLDVFPHMKLDDAIGKCEVDTTASTRGMYVNRFKDEKKKPKKTGRDTKEGGTEYPETSDRGLVDSVVDRIQQTQIETVPFYHLTFDSVFPVSTYQSLIDHLPEDEDYEDLRHRDAMRDDGSSARLHLILTPDSLSTLPPSVREVWLPIYEALASDEVKEALFARHYPALFGRFGSDLHSQNVKPRISLIRDLAGYRIGIHSDIKQKVITTQFYLPQDDSQQEIGTMFYRKGAEGEEKYVFDRRMKFLPNSGYSFAVIDDSFHGVDELAEADAPRNSLMLVYYLDE